jgi:SulP family sulfate permease
VQSRRRHPGGRCRPSVYRCSTQSASAISPSALAIALLGLLEAISWRRRSRGDAQKLDLNQQCLSEGVANLTGSFFQCMPGSGSLTRSAHQPAGGRADAVGRASSRPVAVALIMLVFATYARFIPRAALAGLLMLTAARMVNPHELRYHVAHLALRRRDRGVRPSRRSPSRSSSAC